MATTRESVADEQAAHREAMRRFREEQDARVGIPHDPAVTPERVRELMRACGVRPEDNIFSRDIIRAKYPDEEAE